MTTVDKIEIEKFSKLAKDWWNPNGKFKPLHLFNPARIKFIKEKLISHFKIYENIQKPLEGLKILDIPDKTSLRQHHQAIKVCKEFFELNFALND